MQFLIIIIIGLLMYAYALCAYTYMYTLHVQYIGNLQVM